MLVGKACAAKVVWRCQLLGASCRNVVSASVGKADSVCNSHRVFAQMKQSFLTKPDKSSVGCIDAPIVPLCAALNHRPDIFTTSSCSGRAMLWLGDEPPPKRRDSPGLVKVYVTHDLEDVPQLLRIASEFPTSTDTIQSTEFLTDGASPGALWLRFEPLVLHACCRDWEAAQALVAAARGAGLKHAAVSGPGPKLERGGGTRAWRVALDGSERLEMPLVVAGIAAFPLHISEQRAWLESVVRRKFERNFAKTCRLQEIIAEISRDGGAVARALTPHEIARGKLASRDWWHFM